MPLRFSHAMRLSGQRAFGRVFARRQTAGNESIVVHAAPRPDDEPARAGIPAVRLGLSVSRRVGPAVTRAGWKRRIREAFRVRQHQLPPGHDFVVVVRGRATPSASEMESMLVDLSRRAVGRPSRGRHGSRAGGGAR